MKKSKEEDAMKLGDVIKDENDGYVVQKLESSPPNSFPLVSIMFPTSNP